MRHIFIIDGGNAAEEFPFGSMLYSFFVHEWRPCEHSSVQTLQDGPMPLHDGR